VRKQGIQIQSLARNLVDNRAKLIKICAELAEHKGLECTWLCGVPMSEVAELLGDIKVDKRKPK